MKKTIVITLSSILLTMGLAGSCTAEEAEAKIVAAIPVTEVQNSGETLAGVRIEFSEEVPATEVYSTALGDAFTARVDREVEYIYISESGEWGDVAAESGKYCFIDFADGSSNVQNYVNDITFSEPDKTRGKIQFFVGQNKPITTVSGTVIGSGATMCSSNNGEMRLLIDDFEEFIWTDEETGTEIYGYLYKPEGYEENTYPMVVHFPAGDRLYTEWNGGYRGALFTHQDVVVWASDEVQAENPCFVLTIGEPVKDSITSEMYLKMVDEVVAQYGIDTSRLYAVAPASGAALMFPAVLENPDKFAALLQCSDNVYHEFETEEETEQAFIQMTDSMPTWFFAASDYNDVRVQQLALAVNEQGSNIDVTVGEQMWNGQLRGEAAAELAREQVARAQANGSDDMVTIFRANTVKGVGHWSWNESFTNAGVWEWLFAQSLDK
ncbi:MAG: hypothetical protein Q4F41_03335 [Eubacteriales bacterium]|nr:hypothetical protein [Eubacteriales bacterium]